MKPLNKCIMVALTLALVSALITGCGTSQSTPPPTSPSPEATITVDINNNTRHTEVLNLYYDRSTIEELDWENLRSQYVWLVSDVNRGTIHWLLEE